VKLTEKKLKMMILSEFNMEVSGQDDPLRVRNDFHFSKFENDTRAALDHIKKLGDMARDDESLALKDLEDLKMINLQQLDDALNYLESSIDARLGGNRGYTD
tara:strand:+ start:110 stop:415 length:306 start_codon:yes stop_codon:yes gene_type:complete